MKKMITLALTALLIFVCLAFPVGAANEGIMLTGALCPECSYGQMIHKPVVYTEWDIIGAIRCTHGDPWATDEIQERGVTDTYTCSYCGISDITRTTETRIVHHT